MERQNRSRGWLIVDLFRRFSFDRETKHDHRFAQFEQRFNALEQRLNEVITSYLTSFRLLINRNLDSTL